ncbi:PIG-L deacetylase family protein [Pseudomonas coleopterorum]|uniref:PIG-L deacetylase family protein n=1 Tax=Pseudomonas coleopterorum TaxID=1605838 RepID=UPI000899B683|nr:PIG-L family deacetylase [Pseudomonas coleopterorum]SEE22775.1 N-acetylglucosaminyl deacetylase, LmbE family [Pseudomonas coleopterorum]
MKENPIVGQGTPLQAWRSSRHLAELPLIDAQTLVPAGSRAVIIAPHPDDEVLGCGGLLQLLAQLERPILIISVTDGSASHPGSQTWTAERLSAVRPQESNEALRRLGLPLYSLQWIRGGFADSGVARDEQRLTDFIQRYLKPNDVVFSTWCNDGHTDHEASGRAGATAAAAVGAVHHELPIWTWHWAAPEDDRIPWERARKLPLDNNMVARKSHAAHAFASQLEGDPQIGLAPVLPPYVLERLLQPFEVVFL